MEAIKHILGLCGEPHGLIYTLFTIGGVSTLAAYVSNIKWWGNKNV